MWKKRAVFPQRALRIGWKKSLPVPAEEAVALYRLPQVSPSLSSDSVGRCPLAPSHRLCHSFIVSA